jgi:hypothetical protein
MYGVLLAESLMSKLQNEKKDVKDIKDDKDKQR